MGTPVPISMVDMGTPTVTFKRKKKLCCAVAMVMPIISSIDGQDDLLLPLLVFDHKSGVAEVVYPSQDKRMQVYIVEYNR